MRLDDETDDAPGEPGEHESVSGDGPELWFPFFGALWLNGSVLAAMVAARPGGMPAIAAAILWSLALGATAFVARRNRLAFQELATGLLPRERIVLGLIVAGFFLGPAISTGPLVLVDGFLWALPLLIFFAVTPLLARLCLAWCLGGAWMAAATLTMPGPLPLLLVILFGGTWLLAVGAAHFAFTGDTYGLRGWWAIRRLGVSVLPATFAAILAALAVGRLWPPPGLHEPLNWRGLGSAEVRHRAVGELELSRLMWQIAAAVIMVVALFWLMLVLRRLLLKRRRARVKLDILPGQTARLEYRAAPPPPPVPELPGLRGRIVQLWSRWAAAMGAEDFTRRPGETAREFAARVQATGRDAQPPPELTELFEAAHYGEMEPDARDLDRMRSLVQEELSRQSLRRQAPLDPME